MVRPLLGWPWARATPVVAGLVRAEKRKEVASYFTSIQRPLYGEKKSARVRTGFEFVLKSIYTYNMTHAAGMHCILTYTYYLGAPGLGLDWLNERGGFKTVRIG